MRVKLLHPPATALRMPSNLPHGLGVLAASLRGRGHEVALDDLDVRTRREGAALGPLLQVLAFERRQVELGCFVGAAEEQGRRLADRLLERSSVDGCDVVGIGVASMWQIATALLLAQRIRQRRGPPVVLGGPFVSQHADLLMAQHPFVDFAVVGEGEQPLLALLEQLRAGRRADLAGVPSLWHRGDGAPRFNGRRCYAFEDQTSPDFDGLPLHLYRRRSVLGHDLVLPYATIRGCRFRCSFCAYQELNGPTEYKSVDKVVRELGQLSQRYGTCCFALEDANFGMSHDRALQLCEALRDARLGLRWITRLRGDRVDRALCRRMYEAGCRAASIGLESGSDRVLRSMGKPGAAQQQRAIVAASEAGIRCQLYLITGYPHETAEDLRLTVEFLERNRRHIHVVSVYTLSVRRGSPLQTRPETFGVRVVPHRRTFLTHEFDFEELGPPRSRRAAAARTRARQRLIDFCLREIKPRSYRYPYSALMRLLGPPVYRLARWVDREGPGLHHPLVRPVLHLVSRHM